MDLLKEIKHLTFLEVKKHLQETYNLVVKESPSAPTLYLVSYRLEQTDLRIPLCQNCRGIILEKETNRVIGYPFNKFFNSGEAAAHEIDWTSATVYEKVDGSLMKVFWYDPDPRFKEEVPRWIVATNGTIDAKFTEIKDKMGKMQFFYDLFEEAWCKTTGNAMMSFEGLDKSCTYMFELTHPLIPVIVRYEEAKIVHIGTRRVMKSEVFPEIEAQIRGISKPKRFALTSVEECLRAADELKDPYSAEGFVVCDKYFNRIKVKSPAYVIAHHLPRSGNEGAQQLSEFLINALLKGEESEVLAYFPIYRKKVEALKKSLELFCQVCKSITLEVDEKLRERGICDDREIKKIYALHVKQRNVLCMEALMSYKKSGAVDIELFVRTVYLLNLTPSRKTYILNSFNS
ncbi:hypothetical protein HK098_006337 [Nowakowskiella sp. JEL0407]|nr:hypothetical protein HK098_006337 [Nowakowskiella sp. JEL0407]